MDLFCSCEQNLLLETIFQNIPQYIFWKDAHSVYLGCNDKYAQLIGLNNPQEIVGKTDYEIGWLPDGDTVEKFQTGDKETLQGEHVINAEEWLSLKNGTKILTLVNKVPLITPQGTVMGVLGVATDITEKKAIEENLVKARHQLQGMTIISASISHELRTPLAAIKGAAKGIKHLVALLTKTYQAAQIHHLSVPSISSEQFQLLDMAINSIDSKVDQANQVITMLLANISTYHHTKQHADKKCSAKKCITQALSQYAFPSKAKPNIFWKKEANADFIFYGREVLLVHVLFNLLKNAVYFIRKANKGDIHIWIEKTPHSNSIHFKDTGTGIKPENLPQIFEPFFTADTNKGTGIGLAFCKLTLHLLGGNITCHSVWQEYTEFILTFPTPT